MFGCVLLFSISTIGLLFAFYWINKRESGGRIIFTPLLLFCINELMFVWPAAIYARIEGVSPDNYASVVVISSAFAFLAGYLLLRNRSKWSTSGPVRFWAMPLHRPNWNAHFLVLVLCSVFFVLLGLYLYQGMPHAISGLQEFVRNGYDAGVNEMWSEKRLELTKGHFFGGTYRGQGAIRVLLRTGWPYLATIALVLFLHRRQTSWRLVSMGTLLACFIYIGGDGTRGPFLWAMVSILVAVSYYARFRVRTLVKFGLILLLGLVVLSLPQKLSKVAASGGDWKDGVEQLAERLFTGNGIHSVFVIEYVRSGYMDLRWGGIHGRDLAAAMPFVESGIPFTHELFLLQNPNAKATRTTLSSMTCLGNLYGDFGWPGTVVGFFLMGAFTSVAVQLLFRKPKTVANVALVGMTVMSIGLLNLNGIVHSMISLIVLFIMAKMYECGLSLAKSRHPNHFQRIRGPIGSVSRHA